jgi:hypothetical protein
MELSPYRFIALASAVREEDDAAFDVGTDDFDSES